MIFSISVVEYTPLLKEMQEIFEDRQWFQDHKDIVLCQKLHPDRNRCQHVMHCPPTGKYDPYDRSLFPDYNSSLPALIFLSPNSGTIIHASKASADHSTSFNQFFELFITELAIMIHQCSAIIMTGPNMSIENDPSPPKKHHHTNVWHRE